MAAEVLTLAVSDPAGKRMYQAGELRSRRVESIRGLAAIAVLACHSYAFTHITGGWTSPLGHLMLAASWGVYLFFALTGYLIFLPFARHWWGSATPISYSRYSANRVLRILPIYYVVLIIYTAWHRDGGSWSQFGRFAIFWQNYSVHTIYRVDGPMWSLVDEVQFYLLLPLLAVLLGVITRRSRKAAAVGLVGIGFASAIARLWFWIATSDTSKLIEYHLEHWYLWIVSLPLVLCFFVPGMLLALLRVSWEERVPDWTRGWAGRGELWFGLGVVIILVGASSARLSSAEIVAAVGAFFIVGGAVLPFDRQPRLGALDWRPIAWVGLASYSLYLVHQPIVELLAGASWFPNGFVPVVVGALVVSCALAAVGYAVIERPFLSLRRGWSTTRSTS